VPAPSDKHPLKEYPKALGISLCKGTMTSVRNLSTTNHDYTFSKLKLTTPRSLLL
jgi:hypothetical protein